MSDINIPEPALQIDFSLALGQIRSVYLQDALSGTVDGINIANLDKQLSQYVPQDNLKALAKRGLRGELMFPVPCMLEVNPFLLGYYRLLLGFSQKEF
ncbi:MAG: XcyI family restriction endonuclease, partial [Candidatus Electrothrix sp. AR5]|nr:XcyI family restriction endonuclease [Candidatus Electrothrix sp. AR5]